MVATLFVISALLFLITFGINAFIPISEDMRDSGYIDNFWKAKPIISGFILAPTSISLAFNLNWFLSLLIIVVVTFTIIGYIVKAYLVRFASGKGLETDIKWTFILGIIFFIIGLGVKFLL
jgi:steroid 5-alpha reductase family enzyme